MTKQNIKRLNQMRDWREAHPVYAKKWEEAHPGYNKKRMKERKANDPEYRLYSKVWDRENHKIDARLQNEKVEDKKQYKAEHRTVPPYKIPSARHSRAWINLSIESKKAFIEAFYPEGRQEFEKIVSEKIIRDEKLLSRIGDDALSTMSKAITPKKGAKRSRSKSEQENAADPTIKAVTALIPLQAIEEEERPSKKQKTDEGTNTTAEAFVAISESVKPLHNGEQLPSQPVYSQPIPPPSYNVPIPNFGAGQLTQSPSYGFPVGQMQQAYPQPVYPQMMYWPSYGIPAQYSGAMFWSSYVAPMASVQDPAIQQYPDFRTKIMQEKGNAEKTTGTREQSPVRR
ncbi:MAG: hypothetical protein K0R63_726 [Rickettsiales bacterium]|jgi:hypothetical protein|nr:hypothetical protein [Rickettsiales bacterium]